MYRRVGIAASLIVLAVAAALAATGRERASYTRDQVVAAFAQKGFTLTDAEPITLVNRKAGGAEALLIPKTKEPFFVYVGRSDALAKKYFEPIARLALPPETFDVLQGNVIVSSDSGLRKEDRKRIGAAMRLLGLKLTSDLIP